MFLTRLGGGVFGNAQEGIDAAIIAAVEPVPDTVDIEIILNNYTLNPSKNLRDLVDKCGRKITCY